ncbi:hypothetical protein [Persephonella sp.]
MKPNDFLILESVIHYKLNDIITLDFDFIEIVKEEVFKVISIPYGLKSLKRRS